MLLIQQVTAALFVAVLILSVALSCLYAHSQVSLLTHLVSVLTWIMNFGLVLLVPIDIYFSFYSQQPEFEQKRTQVSSAYLWMYWVVYLLTWTIVPLVQGWEDSGALTSIQRLKRSLISNGWFYLYMIIGAILFVIAMYFLYPGLFSSTDLLKALGYCYGMFLLMMLLSYSIVKIPKTLYILSDQEKLLGLSRGELIKARKERQEATMKVQENAALFLKLQQDRLGQQFDQITKAIRSRIPEETLLAVQRKYKNIISDEDLQPVRSLDDAINLHSAAKHSALHLQRTNIILTQKIEQLKKIKCSSQSQFSKVKKKVMSIALKGMALILATFGLIIVISQFQLYIGMNNTLLKLLLLQQDSNTGLLIQVLGLLYLSVLSFHGMFALKISDYYGLYPRHTDGASLMFSTINFSRVSAPLVLNFMQLLGLQESIYLRTMGHATQIWLVRVMPMLLALLIVLNYFQLWSKGLRALGLEDWNFQQIELCQMYEYEEL